MSTEIKQIMDKLNHIQSDIDYIKKHMTDVDTILSDDDRRSIQEAEEDLKAGRAKRLL